MNKPLPLPLINDGIFLIKGNLRVVMTPIEAVLGSESLSLSSRSGGAQSQIKGCIVVAAKGRRGKKERRPFLLGCVWPISFLPVDPISGLPLLLLQPMK